MNCGCSMIMKETHREPCAGSTRSCRIASTGNHLALEDIEQKKNVGMGLCTSLMRLISAKISESLLGSVELISYFAGMYLNSSQLWRDYNAGLTRFFGSDVVWSREYKSLFVLESTRTSRSWKEISKSMRSRNIHTWRWLKSKLFGCVLRLRCSRRLDFNGLQSQYSTKW